MTDDLTSEEKRIIFHAVRYWQIHKASLNGKEYKTCENILNRWFDDVKLQQQEQPQ